MNGIKASDILGMRINLGGTCMQVQEAKYNGEVVWPVTAWTYVVTSARVVYSESSRYPGETLNYITAKGTQNGVVDNYATIVGTVEKRRGSTVIETYTDVTLTPVNTSGTSIFFVAGSQVQGYNLGNTIKSLTSCTFGAKYVNGGIESEVFNVTISQQGNSRSVYVAEYTTGFSITAPSKVSSDGATVAIGGIRSYVTTEYVYDSGSHQGGDAAQAGVNATSVTINSKTPSGYWCSTSGGSIVVNANTEYTSDRSATFTATYDGYSDSGTITQWCNDYTSISYNCTALTLGASSVAATVYGRGNGVSVTFTATKTTAVIHDGVERDPVTVVSPDAHYIINSNVAFELYNSTRGSSATSQLTAYSGDTITIYPLAENTSYTTAKDTYISALNSGQVHFTQNMINNS